MGYTRARAVDGLRRRLGLAAAVTASALVVGVGPAAADSTIYPTVECVANSGSDGAGGTLYTAYFGYVNTGSSSENIASGDDNLVTPGAGGFAGQPTTFSPGDYPSVFSVEFDTAETSTTEWLLDGTVATATTSSTPCVAGVTGTASSVTSDSVTLDGVVEPLGSATTYSFQWGTDPSSLQSTASQTVTSNDPQLVTTQLAGLAPNTTYYYELVADNGRVSTVGSEQSFTTNAQAAPSPTAAVSLSGAVPASYRPGQPSQFSFTVANGGPSPAANVTLQILLPSGARLSSASGAPGACTGTTVISCSVGTLAAGASTTITAAVQPGTRRTLPVSGFVTTSTANTDQDQDLVSLRTNAHPWRSGAHGPRHAEIAPRHHRRRSPDSEARGVLEMARS